MEFERPAVPEAVDRPEAGAAAVADPRAPAPAMVPEPATEEVLAGEPLGVAAAVAGVAGVPRNVTAPYGFARVVPATPPVVALVCAAAGAARISENRNAVQSGLATNPSDDLCQDAALLGSRAS